MQKLKTKIQVVPCYTIGPVESREIIARTECATLGCDRFSCTASEIGFAQFCCRSCAETGIHSLNCNRLNPEQQQQIVPGGKREDADTYFERLKKEFNP